MPYAHTQGTNLVEIFVINNLNDNDWRKAIVSYLENPNGTTCRKIKYRALSYVIMGNELFKKTPEGVLLKCLGETEAYMVVSSTHSGVCGTRQAGHKMKWLPGGVLDNYVKRLHRICKKLSRMPKTLRDSTCTG